METAAPTIRALELENQKLRADVAELVERAKALLWELDYDDIGGMVEGQMEAIRAVLAKHGA